MTDTPHPVPVIPTSRLHERIRRRGLRALSAGVVAFAIVLGVTLVIPPVYESRASIRIEPTAGARGGMDMAALGSLGSIGGLSSLGGDGQVVTEMGILGSRRLLEPMVQQLALHVSVEEPRAENGVREPLFAMLKAGRETTKGRIVFTRAKDGSYAVTVSGDSMVTAPVPSLVKAGDTVSIGAVQFVLDQRVTAPRIELKTRPFNTVMRSIDRTLRIRRDATGSRLVHLRFRHEETAVAKAFVDGVMALYLDQATTLVETDPARRVAFLGTQVRAARARADAAEQVLVAAQQGGALPPREALEFEAKRKVEMTVRRDALNVELNTLDAFLAGNVPPQALLAFPSFFEAGPTGSVLDALLNLETRRDSLLVQRTPENREVQLISARILSLEGTLQTLVKQYRVALGQRVTAANEALNQLAPEMTPLPARVVAAERAAKELELLGEVAAKLEQLELQARTEQALAKVESRVVDPGTVSDRPIFPRLDINLVLGAVLAVLVGLFVLLSGAPRSSEIRSA